VQLFIHHPAPHGMAGFVLANGSLSSKQSGDGLLEAFANGDG
jgi:type I restriction enzyme M protein